jgi:hypothetical protein
VVEAGREGETSAGDEMPAAKESDFTGHEFRMGSYTVPSQWRERIITHGREVGNRGRVVKGEQYRVTIKSSIDGTLMHANKMLSSSTRAMKIYAAVH